MDKQNVAYLYRRVLFAVKMKAVLMHTIMAIDCLTGLRITYETHLWACL